MKNIQVDSIEKELLKWSDELSLVDDLKNVRMQTKDLFETVVGEKLMNIKCDRGEFCFDL